MPHADIESPYRFFHADRAWEPAEVIIPRPKFSRAGIFPANFDMPLPIAIIKYILNPNYIARGDYRMMVGLGLLRATVAMGALRAMVAEGLPREFIAMGPSRNRTIVGITNQVAQTANLLPNIDSTVEIETVTWDYGLILKTGVTITAVTALTCSVSKPASDTTTDPTPQSRIIGSPQLGPSPNSGGANQAVLCLVGTMIAGVTYLLQCVVTTSDGQTISLWQHLGCTQPT
jgi:hypothetical protein